METKYFNQIPDKSFELLDRINVVYSSLSGVPAIQIYPFRAKVDGKEYRFPGLSSGVWSPYPGNTVLAEIDENNNLTLSVVPDDLQEYVVSDYCTNLGIVIYIGKEEITILNHSKLEEIKDEQLKSD